MKKGNHTSGTNQMLVMLSSRFLANAEARRKSEIVKLSAMNTVREKPNRRNKFKELGLRLHFLQFARTPVHYEGPLITVQGRGQRISKV